MFNIENEYLKASATPNSGCLTSVYSKVLKRELLWQVDKAWGTQDIVIFPMIALPTFCVDGKEYICTKRHGILRPETFEELENDGNTLVLKQSSNENTMKQYPFEYDFFVKYSLEGNALTTTYKVCNKDGKKMPFYIGGHAGYYLKNGEGILKFAKTEKADFYPVVGGMIEKAEKWELDDLVINKALFKEKDTVVLSNIDTSNMKLIGNDNLNLKLKLNSPVIAVWSNPDIGDYVCVEPWWGIGDMREKSQELSEREFINFAEANSCREFSHSIEFEII